MAVAMNVEDSTLTIEDMGVTVRTLLAHAAEGYKVNQRRKWDIIYKGVAIASVRVRTKNKEPLIPTKPVSRAKAPPPVAYSQGDGGVIEGTNRTTSGAIGQP